MRKLFWILTLLSLFLIISCELFTDEPIKGDVYYINVGIDYENYSGFNALYGTLNDAKELNKALEKVITSSGRTPKGYLMVQKGEFPVNILNPDYPSKTNVQNHLVSLRNEVTENDLTIFTYSGHGYKETGHLALAYSGNGKSADALDPATLLLWMADIPGKKLVILDSCFSGMAVEENPSSTNTILNNSLAKFFETYHSSDTYGKPDLFVLTASAHTDSYEAKFDSAVDHNHGFFTYALLEGLGWDHPHSTDLSTVNIQELPAAKNNQITVDGLFKYIKKNQDINSRFVLFSNQPEFQHPMTTGGPLDLVLFNL